MSWISRASGRALCKMRLNCSGFATKKSRNYVSDLNCTDSKARTILGSAFGVKSIAHVLACLAGIGEA